MAESGLDTVGSRFVGGVVLACGGVTALMVGSQSTCSGSRFTLGYLHGDLTLFSWTHWLLVGILLASGLLLALQRGHVMSLVAASSGLVSAGMLAGVSVVAYKRWHPAGGMSGCGLPRNHYALQSMSILAAAAGALAFLACLGVLRRLGMGARREVLPLGVGALVAVLLPIVLAVGGPDTRDVTSLGAFALLWSLPWGLSLALSAWLVRPAAVTIGATVAVTSVTGYPHYELVLFNSHLAVVIAGLGAGIVVAAASWTRPSTPIVQPQAELTTGATSP